MYCLITYTLLVWVVSSTVKEGSIWCRFSFMYFKYVIIRTKWRGLNHWYGKFQLRHARGWAHVPILDVVHSVSLDVHAWHCMSSSSSIFTCHKWTSRLNAAEGFWWRVHRASWVFLCVWRLICLSMHWALNCSSEVWQRCCHCVLSEVMESQVKFDISQALRVGLCIICIGLPGCEYCLSVAHTAIVWVYDHLACDSHVQLHLHERSFDTWFCSGTEPPCLTFYLTTLH